MSKTKRRPAFLPQDPMDSEVADDLLIELGGLAFLMQRALADIPAGSMPDNAHASATLLTRELRKRIEAVQVLFWGDGAAQDKVHSGKRTI